MGLVLKTIALTLVLAGAASVDEPCSGVGTTLTDEQVRNYAGLVAGAISEDLEPSERLQPSDVEIYSLLKSGSWSALYGAIPTADIAMFFFEEVGGRQEFRDVWGGWAEPSERTKLIEWAENLGVPEKLATCFAHYILDDAASEQPYGFSLELEFSDKALSTLKTQGEEVIVAASYYGSPNRAGEKHADDVGQIDLGREEVQVPAEPGPVQVIGSGLDIENLKWIEGEVMVNVNVYSARLSSDDNLISCDLIDGPFSAIKDSIVTLDCALIEEGKETELKP